jgi:hypothetical protein
MTNLDQASNANWNIIFDHSSITKYMIATRERPLIGLLRRKQMKSIVLSFILLLGISSLFSACSPQGDEKLLNSVDAVQAMAIANDWNWSKKEIKSFVTSREVVFKFSKEKEKRIPLPNDKMLIAVAPYINQTHE